MPALAELDTFLASQQPEAAEPEVAEAVEPAAVEPATAAPEAAAPEAAAPEAAAPEAAAPEVAAPEVTEPVAAEEAAEASAEPEATEAAADVAAEGAVPDAAPTAAVVDPTQTASQQAFGDQPAAQQVDLSHGTFAPEDYQAACTAAGTPEKWDDRYYSGHTEASQWHQPYDHGYANTFTLQRGQSASQGLKDFLAGPTIADWRVIALALELDDVRDTLGDHKFDSLFGSVIAEDDAQIPVTQRLQISVDLYTTPLADQMKELAEEKDAALDQAPEPAAPAIAAQVEDKPLEVAATQEPAPELVAEELGVERERDREYA